MNFYKHYIGDFQRDTGHLSLTQRGAYLCLMHHYYATEKPLPDDHAALCRIAGAIDKAEREAVRAAMGFFVSCESGLMHTRIEAELHKAGTQADTNRRIAQEREDARRAAREIERLAHEQSTKRATNREPNQTPDTRQRHNPPHPPEGEFVRFWQAYPSNPRKVARRQCLAKWRAQGCEAIATAVMAGLEAFKASDDWRKDGGAFIPSPLVWLNQRRWEAIEALPPPGPSDADRTRLMLADMAARPMTPPPADLMSRIRRTA